MRTKQSPPSPGPSGIGDVIGMHILLSVTVFNTRDQKSIF